MPRYVVTMAEWAQVDIDFPEVGKEYRKNCLTLRQTILTDTWIPTHH